MATKAFGWRPDRASCALPPFLCSSQWEKSHSWNRKFFQGAFRFAEYATLGELPPPTEAFGKEHSGHGRDSPGPTWMPPPFISWRRRSLKRNPSPSPSGDAAAACSLDCSCGFQVKLWSPSRNLGEGASLEEYSGAGGVWILSGPISCGARTPPALAPPIGPLGS